MEPRGFWIKAQNGRLINTAHVADIIRKKYDTSGEDFVGTTMNASDPPNAGPMQYRVVAFGPILATEYGDEWTLWEGDRIEVMNEAFQAIEEALRTSIGRPWVDLTKF